VYSAYYYSPFAFNLVYVNKITQLRTMQFKSEKAFLKLNCLTFENTTAIICVFLDYNIANKVLGGRK
jgi:hypothetical protein